MRCGMMTEGDIPVAIGEAVDRFFVMHPEFVEGCRLANAYHGMCILFFQESNLWAHLQETGPRNIREDFWRVISGDGFKVEPRNRVSVAFRQDLAGD